MNEYLLTVKAKWVSSYEHPGGKQDVHSPKSRTLSVRFKADNLISARQEAQRRIDVFKGRLPKKKGGSLSWQSKDAEIASVTFSQILQL